MVMKEGFFRACAGCLSVFAWMLAGTSCIQDEYGLERGIDTTMQLGGDSLAIPLGTTVPFTVDSLMKDNSVSDILVLNSQGVYVLSPSSVSVREEMEMLPIEDLKLDSVGQALDFPIALVPSPSAKAVRMSGNVYQEIELDFDFDKISAMILKLKDMTFSPKTRLKFDFQLTDVPEGIDPEGIVPDLEVEFPETFSFDDALVWDGNIFPVTEFDAGTGSFSFELPLAGLDLSLAELVEHRLNFQARIILSGTLSWTGTQPAGNPSPMLMSGDIPLEAKVECSVTDIEPERVKGIFSASMPTRQLSVSFGDMPDPLTSSSTVLDFANPRMLIRLESNTGIPVDGFLTVAPVFDGKADMASARQTNIRIPAGNPETFARYDFWLAKDRSEMPYGYLFHEFDMASLLRRIPDSFLVTVEAKTDTLQVHEYVFGERTRINAEIVPEVPLVFGEELHIAYADTLSGMPEDFASFLEGRQMEIQARIDNSFPLDIHVRLELLDENGVLLPIETSGGQVVRACGRDAETEVSTLSFLFSDREGKLAGKKISSVRLGCSVRSGVSSAGIPVYGHSRLQAELKAKMEGGIVLKPGRKE